MNVNYPALSMKADAYYIKNPLEMTNSFTKKNADDAGDVLVLNDKLSLETLKESLKGYDFTSVSTYELAMAGSLLYEHGLLSDDVAHFFTSGRRAYDETGRPTGTDVKFNAIAMFNQMLEGRLADNSTQAEGYHRITKGLIKANHVLAALSFFANSAQSDLSVSIQA